MAQLSPSLLFLPMYSVTENQIVTKLTSTQVRIPAPWSSAWWWGSQTCALHVRTACVMARHVLVSCAMVLVARSESTSSEGRRLHIRAVPVRSAHRTAVHGGGLWVAAFPLPRGAHAAVACLSVLSSHFLGMCTGFPRPKSLCGVLTSMSSGSRVDGVHVCLRYV